jgi:hypothetical protein
MLVTQICVYVCAQLEHMTPWKVREGRPNNATVSLVSRQSTRNSVVLHKVLTADEAPRLVLRFTVMEARLETTAAILAQPAGQKETSLAAFESLWSHVKTRCCRQTTARPSVSLFFFCTTL